MKKTTSAFLLTLILLWNVCFPAYAAEKPPVGVRTDFPDGSYCITTITVEQIVPSVSDGTRYSITGTKSNAYYNGDNLQFTVSVRGTFTYDCNNAWATSSQYGYHISNTSWSFVSGSSSCSGATATATCTFHNTNGSNRTLSVSLTCSPLGVLS